MNSKKAVSPVVAVALLLVTTVIAAVGFQTWFNEFSTELFTDTETKGDADGLTSRIETIVDGNLYVYSGFTNNVSYSNLQVAGKTCNISGQLANGVNTIDITSCSAISSGVNEVVVITQKGVISEEIYVGPGSTSTLSVTCTNASAPYHGGSGNSSDPYEICNCSQLEDVGSNLTADYELVQNIDCSVSSSWDSGNGFDPIGGSFTGTFDGGSYEIQNLYIRRTGNVQQGLFSAIQGGTISNLGVTGANVTGSQSTGIIVGYAHSNAFLDNVYASGNSNGTFDTGGLMGYGSDVSINNSYSTATVTGHYNLGGIVGEADSNSEIWDSYSTGSVSGVASSMIRVGGIVGAFTGGIYSSYSTGAVTGSNGTGGILGTCAGGTCVLNNTYATGAIDGVVEVGGLVGYPYNANIENSYASGSVNGSDFVGGLIGAYRNTDVNHSFSTGGVSGSGSSVGGFAGGSAGGSNSFQDHYWNNQSGNPSAAGVSSTTTVQDTLSYFYSSSNAPMGNWSGTVWSFSGSALPILS